MRDDALPFPAQPAVAGRFAPPAERAAVPALLQSVRASQYRAMEAAFRATGGVASSDELVFRLRRHASQPISRLARWIVDRHVIGFEWQGHTLLPLFQFEPDTLTPRAGVTTLIRELVPALSDWEIAVWFAQPNVWLDGQAPADVVLRDVSAVFNAALAERYLARG